MVRPEAQRLSSTVILPHRSMSEAVSTGSFGLSKQSPDRNMLVFHGIAHDRENAINLAVVFIPSQPAVAEESPVSAGAQVLDRHA